MTSTEIREKLKKLNQEIKYENAMYETALAYPTETAQFYDALARTRKRIEGMYNQKNDLEAQLQGGKE